ncbi:hypothetical protein X727_23205 [Mesorhizobium sp. L103C119B0]|uniref:hypothetical protein n=1 Tax=Mesorhizobium sp. L103C119B0 TaxID=1287085 RepID=UPI0003D053AB|nr:hypothetical protein [Mesorhizobium sp. L103C119B0]ESZ68187.1 hypothetical protein X727_23205 [Mesorhizobium sp. L103C119B0]
MTTQKTGIAGRLRIPATDLRDLRPNDSNGHKNGFETRTKARLEDAYRKRLLERVSKDPADPRKTGAAEIVQKLKPPVRAGDLPDTFASMRATRHFRRVFCGSLIDSLQTQTPGSIFLYTVVSADWVVPGPDLAQFDPKKLLELFRAQLNRRGLATRSGWLVVSVHGDYDEDTDLFQPHLHILAVGDAHLTIEAVRECASYKSGDVAKPILRLIPVSLEWSVPYYVMQPFWPRKARSEDGRRIPGRFRIPPDRLVDWLLWIDQQSFADLTWMYRCKVVGGKIVAGQK